MATQSERPCQPFRADGDERMGRRRAPFWYADATMTTVNGRSVKRRLIESKREARGFWNGSGRQRSAAFLSVAPIERRRLFILEEN